MRLVSGGTDNHLMLVDLRTFDADLSGKKARLALDRAGISLNENTVPDDPRPPYITTGLRIGTPAVTTQGMAEPEMARVAELIYRVWWKGARKQRWRRCAMRCEPRARSSFRTIPTRSAQSVVRGARSVVNSRFARKCFLVRSTPRVYCAAMQNMAGKLKAGAACSALALVGLLGFGATAASAGQACPPVGHSGTQVCGNVITPPNDPVVRPAVDPGGLAITGADVLGLTIIGSAAVLTGTAVLRLTRRTSQPA